MMYKFATTLFFIGSILHSNAQNLPLDFESNQHTFTVFGGTQFERVKDPLRPNNNVGSFKNTAGSNYEGAFIDLQNGINLDSSQKIRFTVFNTSSDSFNLQFKLEKSTSGEPDIFVQKRYKTSTWLTDSFDFSKARIVDIETGIKGKGIYKRFTLFFDAGITKAGQFYLDDITGFIPSGGSQQNAGITHYGKLVWADEFDYSGKPKAENWHPQVIPPNNGGWFNGEIQHYTDKLDNAYVSDGSMKIVLKKERYTYDNSTKDYTSARLNSKFAFTYGRVDVRAKLPAGNGVWPAIWTLGTNVGETGNYWGRNAQTVGWPKCGEMDIMESWGHNPRYVSSAVHTQARFGGVETGGTFLPDPYNDYHVYSLVWSPEKLMFFVDSVEIYTYQPDVLTADNWPFTKDQYLLLNIAVLPQVASNFDSSRMEIDYVRVYQQGEDSGTLNTGSGQAKETGKIYPNPVREKIFIEDIAKYEGYSIMDMGGREVQSGLLQETDGIAVQELAGGLYHLRLLEASNSEGEAREVYFRVIKE
jgi:beta-glucanase (GH16 family)